MIQIQEQSIDLEMVVQQAAKLLVQGENSNWELARLTFEYTLSRGEKNTNKLTMKQWAERVATEAGRRFSVATAKRYKVVWEKHHEDDVTKLSFYEKLHEVIEDQDPKDEILPTHTEVQEQVPPENVIEFTPSRSKQDQDDSDDVSRYQISDEELAERERTDPILSQLVQERNLTDIQIISIDAIDALESVDKRLEPYEGTNLGELDELDRHVMEQLLEKGRQTLSRIERILNTGNADVQRFNKRSRTNG